MAALINIFSKIFEYSNISSGLVFSKGNVAFGVYKRPFNSFASVKSFFDEIYELILRPLDIENIKNDVLRKNIYGTVVGSGIFTL